MLGTYGVALQQQTTTTTNFEFHKMLGTYGVTLQQVAFRVVFSSTELVRTSDLLVGPVQYKINDYKKVRLSLCLTN
jgi:hypothetical protein